MRGIILLLLLALGIGFLAQKNFDFDINKQIEQIEQMKEEIKIPKIQTRIRHIREEREEKEGKTFHKIPPGCKDTEGRVLTPLRAECR
jgi:hypothetical protein